jgi:hypothetical protein
MHTAEILDRIKRAEIVNDPKHNIKIKSRKNPKGEYNSIETSFLFPEGSMFIKMTLQFVSYNIDMIKLIMLFNDSYYDAMSIVDADYENISSFIKDNNIKACIEALGLTSADVYLQDFEHNGYAHTNLVLEFKNHVAHLRKILDGGKKIVDAMHAKYQLVPIDAFGLSATHGIANGSESVKPSVAQTLSTLSGSPPPKAANTANTANSTSAKKFVCVVVTPTKPVTPVTPVWKAPALAPAPVEQAPAPTPVEQAPAPAPVEQAPAPTPVEQAPAQVDTAPTPAVQVSAPKKKKILRPRKDEIDALATPVEPATTLVVQAPTPVEPALVPGPAPTPVKPAPTLVEPAPVPSTLSITERMEAILLHIHAEMRAIGATVAEQKRKLDQEADAKLAPLMAQYEKVSLDLDKLKKIAEEQEARKREQTNLMAAYANYTI